MSFIPLLPLVALSDGTNTIRNQSLQIQVRRVKSRMPRLEWPVRQRRIWDILLSTSAPASPSRGNVLCGNSGGGRNGHSSYMRESSVRKPAAPFRSHARTEHAQQQQFCWRGECAEDYLQKRTPIRQKGKNQAGLPANLLNLRKGEIQTPSRKVEKPRPLERNHINAVE